MSDPPDMSAGRMETTVCIKLLPSDPQRKAVTGLMAEMAVVRTVTAKIAAFARCKNRYAMQKLVYADIATFSVIGAQMKCIAIREVAAAYKTQYELGNLKKDEPWPTLEWSPKGSVSFDARTMRYVEGGVSLYTMQGRIVVPWVLGRWQKERLTNGTRREAKVVCKRGIWYLHVTLRHAVTPIESDKVMGVDVGENNIAATSSGKVLGGKRLRHERDKYLALRSRLQHKGTKGVKRRLATVSGAERRHVRHVNHVTSKAIVAEAKRTGCGVIAMEDLTYIRDRIRAGKRMRGRLHRWAWRQLQRFVEYKAGMAGMRVMYIDPAYTSQTCSRCQCLGQRRGSLFECACGSRQHADANAARNIGLLSGVITSGTGRLITPDKGAMVAAKRSGKSSRIVA